MKHTPRLILSLLTLLTPALAQSPAQLKAELKKREAAAKKNPDALVEVGKWAATHALTADAKRLFQAALKAKPDHAGANEALGNELVEGKWLPKKEAEALRMKALATEFAAKGLVDVDGVWVEKDKVDDAKKGIYHHDGEVVNREEKVGLLSGKVRHPVTGLLIDAKDLEKAQGRYFPIGGDRWVDEKEANTFHSDFKKPWIVRGHHITLLTTMPIAKVEPLLSQSDIGFERVAPLLGGKAPAPTRRPVVWLAESNGQYTELGAAFGDGSDAAGIFLGMPERVLGVPTVGEVRPVFCRFEKDWLERDVRHATAMAYAASIAEEAGADLPLWLLQGFGSYTSRFENDSDAAWFAKQHMARGGVRSVKSWFSAFAISGESESADIAGNLFQAGLMLRFAAGGGDAGVTEAMQALTALLSGQAKGSADKAISKLEAALVAAEPAIAKLCQELAAKSQ